MIFFPKGFTATKYPGYFWNIPEQQLYSCKTGVLKKIKRSKPNRFNHDFDGYKVSHLGIREKLQIKDLTALKLEDHRFPLYVEEPKP